MKENKLGQSDTDTVRLQRAVSAIKNLRQKVAQLEGAQKKPVAIIGMGCRFPSNNNPKEFWDILRAGGNAVRIVPDARWKIDKFYDVNPQTAGKMYTRHGGFLDDIDSFDESFFGISPRESAFLDPQQKLLMEVSWEALEYAGLNPEKLDGSPTGVFIGIAEGEYLQHLHEQNKNSFDIYSLTGTASSVACGRLSYFLGLHGPSLAIDTACSSSLVAVHLAVNSLRSGECTLALAGGVNVLFTPHNSIAFCQAKALSPDGLCKSFDDSADGYTRSEGCGIIVLKLLDDALRDEDNILAVIRGSAVNQDGKTNGLTAPNGLSQQKVIRKALENANADPAEIGYIETHGTGTQLGDPIEANALGTVFRERNTPLLIGTVKTNIGHLEAAAGIAGLIKSILILQNNEVPPNLHFKTPNSHIAWNDLPLKVPTEKMPLPPEAQLIGVSSFGFSGTNAHIILEKAPLPSKPSSNPERPLHILTVSAKSREALIDLAAQYAEILHDNPFLSFADVCYTANAGRANFPHRLSVSAQSSEECGKLLAEFAEKKFSTRVIIGKADKKPKVAFLFTGQGSQFNGMGKPLFSTNTVFRQTLERCDEILRDGGYLEKSLIEVIYAEPGSPDAQLIDTAVYAQTALFALEFALAELWRSFGIKPDILLGHSVGEYAAAAVAGVFSLEDGLHLVAHRARLLQSTAGNGATIAVLSGEESVRRIIAPMDREISVAGINSPKETLISGSVKAIAKASEMFKVNGISSRSLKISYAPHSHLIEPLLDDFEEFARRINYNEPQIKLISNATGRLIDKIDSAYWRRHLRESVRFIDGVRVLAEEDCRIMLEIGPQPVLQLLGRQNWEGEKAVWLSSLWSAQDDWKTILQSLGELYVHGKDVDWEGFERGYDRRRIILPTSPFRHLRRQAKNFVNALGNAQNEPSVKVSKMDEILKNIKENLAGYLDFNPELIEKNISFVQLGADSLLLAKMVLDIEEIYGISVGIGQLFEELDTFETLAAYLSENLPAGFVRLPENKKANGNESAQSAEKPAVSNFLSDENDKPEKSGADLSLNQIISSQLEIISRQLSLLENAARISAPDSKENPEASDGKPVNKPPKTESEPQPAARILNETQKEHLQNLIKTYTERTAGSRQRALKYRSLRADTRMRLARTETREMAYPITGKSADGAHFWDIDDNEYVDIAMGVGVLLCGHYPSFIAEAAAEQQKKSIQTGPISELADEVAQMICEMTGMERAFFAVTGTCAVRGALRLAQAATGRSKFVIFSGSYHGQDDRTLAIPDIHGNSGESIPMVMGISPNAVSDALVLPYGNFKSLETIKSHAHELAAVLVEPVQSRNPVLQPKEFLKQLRGLTADIKVPLIFDEIITGFRCHPRGAQGWFEVDADIAVYGKCLGGGLPVSVVAGKAEYLDKVDGGQWINDLENAERIETTFIGSTFEMHPLIMASTRAMLRHLKQEGAALQENLNRKTLKLVETLNGFFENENVPIKVLNFASIFRFAWRGNSSYAYQPLEMEIFHSHLIAQGIYIWEGRTCFLSTVHNDSDLEKIFSAVRKTVAAMRAGGFLDASPGTFRKSSVSEKKNPLSGEQRLLRKLIKNADENSPDWVIAESLRLAGDFKFPAYKKAFQALADRHEALRTVFDEDENFQKILPEMPVEVDFIDLKAQNLPTGEDAVKDWLGAELLKPFDLARGPLIRAFTLKLDENLHQLILIAHHIVTDGWSLGILLEELTAVYSAECRNEKAPLETPPQYREFIEWQTEFLETEKSQSAEKFWLNQFQNGFPKTALPADFANSSDKNYRGGEVSFRLNKSFSQALKKAGQQYRCTPFMTLLGAYGLLLHRMTGQDEIVIGIPTAARATNFSEKIVGYCTHLLPIRSISRETQTIAGYFAALRETVIAAYKHQDYPFARLISKIQTNTETEVFPLNVIFNMDRSYRSPIFFESKAEFSPVPAKFALVDLRLDAIEMSDEIWLDFTYRTDAFSRETINRWSELYRKQLTEI